MSHVIILHSSSFADLLTIYSHTVFKLYLANELILFDEFFHVSTYYFMKPFTCYITLRYIQALHQQLRERVEQKCCSVPPLCSCGDTIWDTNPNTCANNCVFYKNPKGENLKVGSCYPC